MINVDSSILHYEFWQFFRNKSRLFHRQSNVLEIARRLCEKSKKKKLEISTIWRKILQEFTLVITYQIQLRLLTVSFRLANTV